jgi:hypothetical protein
MVLCRCRSHFVILVQAFSFFFGAMTGQEAWTRLDARDGKKMEKRKAQEVRGDLRFITSVCLIPRYFPSLISHRLSHVGLVLLLFFRPLYI